MNVRYSETNAHYSSDSQRDFEDFSEAYIRQTVEGSRPGSDSAVESMALFTLPKLCRNSTDMSDQRCM